MKKVSVLLAILVFLPFSLCISAEESPHPQGKNPTAVPSTLPILSFNPPGARSLAMGSAFIAIADDATASESNPAGLIILTKPEVSLSLRSTTTENQALDPYSLFFRTPVTFEDKSTGPSFASYVYPIPSKNMSFSIYYQKASNFESHERFVLDSFRETFNRFELDMEYVGLSMAARLGAHVSVGASVRYSQLDIEVTNQYSRFVLDEFDPIFEDFTTPFFDRYVVFDERIDDRDQEITFNAGILINPGGKFSAGAVYKEGATFDAFDVQQTTWLFPNLDFFELALDPIEQDGEITIPRSYGIGVAYRPNSHWTLGLDLVRVKYSDTVSRLADPGKSPSDETEIHLGGEYGFILGQKNTPVFVRFGYFSNPDHDATSRIDSKQNYFTLGAGVFINQKFQLDGAIAVSENVTETLISMVWRL